MKILLATLKRKSEYFNINPEDSISHNKRLRHAKYPGLKMH